MEDTKARLPGIDSVARGGQFQDMTGGGYQRMPQQTQGQGGRQGLQPAAQSVPPMMQPQGQMGPQSTQQLNGPSPGWYGYQQQQQQNGYQQVQQVGQQPAPQQQQQPHQTGYGVYGGSNDGSSVNAGYMRSPSGPMMAPGTVGPPQQGYLQAMGQQQPQQQQGYGGQMGGGGGYQQVQQQPPVGNYYTSQQQQQQMPSAGGYNGYGGQMMSNYPMGGMQMGGQLPSPNGLPGGLGQQQQPQQQQAQVPQQLPAISQMMQPLKPPPGMTYNGQGQPQSQQQGQQQQQGNSGMQMLMQAGQQQQQQQQQQPMATGYPRPPVQPPTSGPGRPPVMNRPPPMQQAPPNGMYPPMPHQQQTGPRPIPPVPLPQGPPGMVQQMPMQQRPVAYDGYGEIEEDPLEAEIRRSYTCPFCGKGYTTSGHLARHRRTHLNINPFSCPVEGCTLRFHRADNMKSHARSHARRLGLSLTDLMKKAQSSIRPRRIPSGGALAAMSYGGYTQYQPFNPQSYQQQQYYGLPPQPPQQQQQVGYQPAPQYPPQQQQMQMQQQPPMPLPPLQGNGNGDYWQGGEEDGEHEVVDDYSAAPQHGQGHHGGIGGMQMQPLNVPPGMGQTLQKRERRESGGEEGESKNEGG